ncbi:hypothetical protein GHNINEIG_02333 [Hydrogenovibrio crunogenus]|uniref:Lipoprotein n=1 Tax=Hydrogenovibrio crunogenus TaxID=39765 RepID=A0A4P7P2I7_9GAMM|nr:hypothetical protein [Hydrogenovibrio crunogenus]QBZ84256.1 hypothetical protein GHNINEIG_02333 [Hydrogenovibrio crunogenus]RUM92516.1 MAG: hypothetical protein DSZ27_03145 [Thiomicrospira sp.]
MKWFWGLSMAFFLSGCASLNNQSVQESSAVSLPLAAPEDAKKLTQPLFCGQQDRAVAHLLTQGSYYASLTGKHRQTVCHKLRKLYQQDQGSWQAGWLLAYSFTDKKSCISHEQRRAILQSLQAQSVLNHQLNWLNASYIQTLDTIDTLKARNASLSEKIAEKEALQHDLQQENALLKSQIQALKAIEKTLNKRIGDDRQPR